jgi:hypothetical protein
LYSGEEGTDGNFYAQSKYVPDVMRMKMLSNVPVHYTRYWKLVNSTSSPIIIPFTGVHVPTCIIHNVSDNFRLFSDDKLVYLTVTFIKRYAETYTQNCIVIRLHQEQTNSLKYVT